MPPFILRTDITSLFLSYIFSHTCVGLSVFHNHAPKDVVRTDSQAVFLERLNEESPSPQALLTPSAFRGRKHAQWGLAAPGARLFLKQFCVFPSQPP